MSAITKFGWWLLKKVATGRAMANDDDMSNTLGKLGNNLINAILGGLILWVVCLIKGYSGQIWRMPILATYADKVVASGGGGAAA